MVYIVFLADVYEIEMCRCNRMGATIAASNVCLAFLAWLATWLLFSAEAKIKRATYFLVISQKDSEKALTSKSFGLPLFYR